jgi:transcriptional regulator with XRE-family HTH domain
MPEDEISAVLTQLKAWLVEKKLTEADLARMLGVSRQRLNQWMRGDARPNLQAWLKIKQFLRGRK